MRLLVSKAFELHKAWYQKQNGIMQSVLLGILKERGQKNSHLYKNDNALLNEQ